jgi:phage FluMu protein Com
MIPQGKCVKCARLLTHVDLDAITVGNQITGPLHKGISYVCPQCKTVLGVAIDPIALKADTVREVLEGLGVKPKKQ